MFFEDLQPYFDTIRTRSLDRATAEAISRSHVPQIITRLYDEGFDVRIGARFDLLKAFHQEHRPNWGLFAAFDPDIYQLDARNGVTLFIMSGEEPIATVAMRLYSIAADLHSSLEDGEFWRLDARAVPPPIRTHSTADLARVIHGPVLFSGAMLKRDGWGGTKLTTAMSRLILMWSLAKWSDWEWCTAILSANRGVERKLTQSDYGLRTLSSSVYFDMPGHDHLIDATLAASHRAAYIAQLRDPRYGDLSVPLNAPPLTGSVWTPIGSAAAVSPAMAIQNGDD